LGHKVQALRQPDTKKADDDEIGIYAGGQKIVENGVDVTDDSVTRISLLFSDFHIPTPPTNLQVNFNLKVCCDLMLRRTAYD
jgi:hypothetical protein